MAVDDVHQLGATAQIGLFNLYNALRATGAALIASGNAAPMHLQLRADVVTRLAWGLVYEVHGLSDGKGRCIGGSRVGAGLRAAG